MEANLYCANCGTRNDAVTVNCVRCGKPIRQYVVPQATPPPQAYAPPYGYAHPPQVPNYLVQAILVTVFCCLPFGIVSIIYAAQVSGKVALGDMAGAVHASKQAKLFAWISFGIGGGVILAYALLIAIGVASGNFH